MHASMGMGLLGWGGTVTLVNVPLVTMIKQSIQGVVFELGIGSSILETINVFSSARLVWLMLKDKILKFSVVKGWPIACP